jgi:hypothetical protein
MALTWWQPSEGCNHGLATVYSGIPNVRCLPTKADHRENSIEVGVPVDLKAPKLLPRWKEKELLFRVSQMTGEFLMSVSRNPVIILLAIGLAQAGLLDFEALPDAYFFSSGGQNVDTFYSGLTFGPNVTGLSVSRFGGYDDSGFPPHSGDVVIWDAFDPSISISFDTPIDAFGIWYTSIDPLELDVFDQSNNLLGSVVGNPNTGGTTGTSSFLSFTALGIETVELTSISFQ